MSFMSRILRKRSLEEISKNAALKMERGEILNRKETKQYAKMIGIDVEKYNWKTSRAKMLSDANKIWDYARREAEQGRPELQNAILDRLEKAKAGEFAEEEEKVKKKKEEIKYYGGGGGGVSYGGGFDAETMKLVLALIVIMIIIAAIMSIF
ncbi:MAG: hypothetical protein QXO69_01870 [archaeon]